MLTKNISYLIFSFFAFTATSTPLSKNSLTTRFVFSFGDSYTSTGFNITETKPTPSNIFGNPPYPGDTTDNGVNWIEVLVETLAPKVTLSYNLAFSGATVDASLVSSYPTVLSLINQTQEFIQNLAPKPSYAPWTSENSIFAFWFGVNDIQNSYNNTQNKVALREAVLDVYFDQVDILYQAGARNFIFLTVPPINKTPQMIAAGPSATAEEAAEIAGFNSLLKSKASALAASHLRDKVNVYIYDTQEPFNTVINNPTAFGAPNNTCFDNSSPNPNPNITPMCIWWNEFHPGQAIQKLVGEGVFATLKAGGFF